MSVLKGALVAALLSLAAPALAAPAPQAQVRDLTASAAFKAAVAQLDRDFDRIVADTVALTEIPAPPFAEKARAEAYMAMLKAAGLAEVEMDAEGNVMGLRRGTGPAGGPVVAVAAHLDTVFPAGTDVKVRREGPRLMAPGIADNTHSLAVMLAYVRALDAAGVRTRSDILFVGDVGEEGQGDLRGMRHLFGQGRYKDRIKAFFSLDGTDAAAIANGAIGSRRYRVTFRGPGGHSSGAFGIVNPLAALGKAVVDFNAVEVPAHPRTTYATSVVGGGASVNAIPDSAWLEVDMRSETREELARLDARFLAIVDAAVKHENAARSTRLGAVSAEVKPIGDRPAGITPPEAEIVQVAEAAARAAGLEPRLQYGSTDSNIPISLGIQAVNLGSGGSSGRAHALDEWLELPRAETVKGMSVGLAALVAMADR